MLNAPKPDHGTDAKIIGLTRMAVSQVPRCFQWMKGTSGNCSPDEIRCRPTLRAGETLDKFAASQKRPTTPLRQQRVTGGALLMRHGALRSNSSSLKGCNMPVRQVARDQPDARSNSSSLKGCNMPAQGNALGTEHPTRAMRPEGALEDSPSRYGFLPPLQGGLYVLDALTQGGARGLACPCMLFSIFLARRQPNGKIAACRT